MTTIVSGFNPAGYELYGKNFLTTFESYWPTEVDLVVYTEEPADLAPHRRKTRWQGRSLWDIDGVKDFIDGHQEPRFRGREPVEGWRGKDIAAGYCYRFDAVRFCRQLFIPEHAAGFLDDGDILIWFDADCVAFKRVPSGLVERLLGDDDLITLGRDRCHTDIGFWAIRLSPDTRALLKDIADSYRSGGVFLLDEWHSAFVFDHWVARYKRDGLKHRSLVEGKSNGHVWFLTEIGMHIDHLKGQTRKQLGYSPERHGVTVKHLISQGLIVGVPDRAND